MLTPYEFDAERFSRWMAYVLRHNPERYGLQPDRHGYVDLEEFLRVASQRYPELGASRLQELIASTASARFEIAGGRLRARYGHSIPVEPVGPPVEPPEFLYYGTEAARTEAILAGGLRPMDRRILHLSATSDEALSIAQRKTQSPAVFRAEAARAHRAGVAFYRESGLYLVAHIPAEFLSLEPLPATLPPPGAAAGAD
jgi:putative RNA 2'-phosphotransferase